MSKPIRLRRKTWQDASRVIGILADKISALEDRVAALESKPVSKKKKSKKAED